MFTFNEMLFWVKLPQQHGKNEACHATEKLPDRKFPFVDCTKAGSRSIFFRLHLHRKWLWSIWVWLKWGKCFSTSCRNNFGDQTRITGLLGLGRRRTTGAPGRSGYVPETHLVLFCYVQMKFKLPLIPSRLKKSPVDLWPPHNVRQWRLSKNPSSSLNYQTHKHEHLKVF